MKANLNTILMACLLAVMGWNAKTTFEMSREVSGMAQAVITGKEKDASIDRDIIDLRTRITQCEKDIIELRASLRH